MTTGTFNFQIDREAEIAALGRALALERRAKYIDFQGRRSTFSQFMRRTSERLIKRFPQDLRWTTIRGLYRQYPNLDLPSRMAIIRRTEELLFSNKQEPDTTGGNHRKKNRKPSQKEPLVKEAEPAVAAPIERPQPGKDRSSQLRQEGLSDQKQSRCNDETPFKAVQNQSRSNDETAFNACEKQSRSNRETALNAVQIQSESAGMAAPGAGEKMSSNAGAAPRAAVDKGASRKGQGNFKSADRDPRHYDVQFLKGVGPKMSELLGRLGIKSAEDLLRHYPRQHLDFQNHLKIREVKTGEDVTILGTIKSVGAYESKRSNVSILNISISDGSGSIGVSKFVGGRSNHYLLERYKASYPKGAQVIASGRVERDGYSGRLQLKNAEIEVLGSLAASDDELETLHTGRLVPVYPLTEGLSLRYIRGIIHNALELVADSIEDPLPQTLKDDLNLSDLTSAFWGIHFPESVEEKEEARRRLVFDELLMAQLHLAIRRYRFQTSSEALRLPAGESKLLERFREQLPFKLTGAQERVFGEIARDLASEKPMHRLVQGDVGSGKTVVAAMSALIAIENGYQVAIMAPTEILAEQHYQQFQKWLTPMGIRCALLLGKQGVRERRILQQGLAGGQIHVAIGTHALIQDDVEFKQLGYVVIDEQHRFGVKQRARLKAKGSNPELLTMTATPIPRTLALTLHGDLDVSEIDELPPGRKPIETKLIGAGQKKDLYRHIREQIALGRQVYIVFPLIEESETLSARAATAEYERLRTSVFPEISIGLMHGKLKPQEKDEVMDAFRKGEYKILVSTTVIEVGVDVPNATVMVIENADRFGLAQLHQLRGRVGRGAEKSYCYLVAEVRSELTRQRLGIMTETNDGFVIAEKDLELRGPGEFLGVRQSGLPEMSLADIVQDAKILETARKVAIEIVKDDPELSNYPLLKESIDSERGSEASELMTSG